MLHYVPVMSNRPYPITNVGGKYGSPMGRRSDNDLGTAKLHLRYVPFVDGDYDQGGAYWGSPANLYVAWGYDDEEYLVETYVRASSRADAKRRILDEHAGVTFYR